MPAVSTTFAVYRPNQELAWINIADNKFAPVKDPPNPEPNIAVFVTKVFDVIAPVAVILPTTVPVVIPTNTLALVKNRLVFSITFEEYRFTQLFAMI